MIFLFILFQLIIKIDENKKRILIINIFLTFFYENSNERSSESLRKKFDKFSSKEISIINNEYIIKLGNIEDYENFVSIVLLSCNNYIHYSYIKKRLEGRG